VNEIPASSEEEDWFDPDFLGRLRALFFRLRKRRQLRRKGLQSTPASGFTRDFKDFRPYTRGDDYRSIDWRLYARLGRLFVRLFEEVQEFDVHILVDTSNSMKDPYHGKRSVALRLAAALGYLGLISQHRVNLHSIGTTVKRELPPAKGQGAIRRMVDHLAAMEFGGVTNLPRAFRDFRPGLQKYGIIFVISDCYGREPGEIMHALEATSSWPGESHIIQIHHPLERRPDWEGEIQAVDTETGEQRRLWFTKRERDRYEKAYDTFLETLAAACARRRIDFLSWDVNEVFEDRFITLLSRGSALAGS
jgi:uncharacterized protein (DUF58 family)